MTMTDLMLYGMKKYYPEEYKEASCEGRAECILEVLDTR